MSPKEQRALLRQFLKCPPPLRITETGLHGMEPKILEKCAFLKGSSSRAPQTFIKDPGVGVFHLQVLQPCPPYVSTFAKWSGLNKVCATDPRRWRKKAAPADRRGGLQTPSAARGFATCVNQKAAWGDSQEAGGLLRLGLRLASCAARTSPCSSGGLGPLVSNRRAFSQLPSQPPPDTASDCGKRGRLFWLPTQVYFFLPPC